MYHLNLLSILRELELQKTSIDFQLKCGILDSIDATNELMMIETKAIKIKETLVNQYHVQKNGTPRKITYMEGKNIYTTFMPDRSRLYATSKNDLYDKLMKYYGLSIHDTSFKTIFDLALEEKSKTENSDSKTIKHYKYDFNLFINDSLAKKDIRKITCVDLQEYTQELVTSKHPTYKAFLKYKSVLNIVFNYAVEKEIITSNPVAKIKNSVYKKSCSVTNTSSEKKIHSQTEIEQIKNEVQKRMSQKRYKGYFINGFAILLSIEIGLRCGELCSLRWDDVKDTYIHIHSQQLKQDGDNGSIYYYAPYTKNEKGISQNGRKFPLTNKVKAILEHLKAVQEDLGICSDYIFCHENGEWIKTDAYETCLRRLCQSLGMSVTNNHAFRMSLNSNVLIPLGMPVTERARLLGHSVETNLRHYSFAGKDNLQDICNLLNEIA